MLVSFTSFPVSDDHYRLHPESLNGLSAEGHTLILTLTHTYTHADTHTHTHTFTLAGGGWGHALES